MERDPSASTPARRRWQWSASQRRRDQSARCCNEADRSWDYEAKDRPSSEDIAKLDFLSAQWTDIAGPSLGTATHPLAFSGKKARRLIISAAETAAPPREDWTSLPSDESKRRT